MTMAAIGALPLTGSAAGNHTGNLYSVIPIKGTVTDAELLMYERLVAALTPGAPSF